ncbi:tRNA(Ile)-lysidine synthase [Dyadobacter sp. CECT 9275]|uniref:tRNA(Ile)-lysidine synthase n=1 Tax=Dyadobacter helix TaxID=2822344 RepID=A0A916JCJ2_9BACT|nr:tRNA lysidine(34) synthetase TilS [Dyadobacter sp. CECT 9275]CAG4992076.1 tRNA(Ile)-lysidine synthase [Dyadobacter sp. CECT 9275]
MLDSFLTFINQFNPSLTEVSTLLTVSGGVDSMAMMHLFHKAGLPAAVAHCNFGLRGVESDEDEALVRETADIYGFKFYVTRFETKKYADQFSVSTQMAARDLRYTWFEKIRKENHYHWVATAHHLNDSIETALLNLSRGTGISGFRGVPVINHTIVRPLLYASRDEILAYAMQEGINWREDCSNESLDYQRNVIRHKVIPVLKEINPSLEDSFAVTAERVRAADRLLTEFLENWKNQILISDGNETRIPVDKLRESGEPVYRLSFILEPYGFRYRQVEQILRSSGSSGKIFYSETNQLLTDRNTLILKPRGGDQPLEEIKIQRFPAHYAMAEGILSFEDAAVEIKDIVKSANHIYFDGDQISYPLTVRKWQPGDKFAPLGMEGRKKKVSDLLIDLKLTVFQKEKVRVLVNGDDEIIWVIGIRTAHRFRIQSDTRQVVTGIYDPVFSDVYKR